MDDRQTDDTAKLGLKQTAERDNSAMTEIDIPTHWDLMYPTLVAIQQLGGSATKSELEEEVSQVADLSDEQLSVLFPDGSNNAGTSKILYRLAWARTNLKKINAAENSRRGVWSITSEGTNYLDLSPEEGAKSLRKAVNEAQAEERRSKNERINEKNDDELSDEETEWQNVLLSTLKKMDPDAFERLSMRLLREAGFRNVEVTGKSGDGGIDGVGTYKVSLVSFPTYFQCKRFSGSVSAGTVRDFRGAMTGRGDKGLLITTGSFTSSAIEEANRDGAPPIDLIDGEELCDLLVEYRIGVRVEERIELDVEIIPEFFDNI